MGRLLSGCTPHTAVSAFLWSVLCHIVPPALLGNRHNRSVLLRVLRAFVSLRRHENLTLHQATQGLRTCGFPWLLTPPATSRRTPHTRGAAAGAGAERTNSAPAGAERSDTGRERTNAAHGGAERSMANTRAAARQLTARAVPRSLHLAVQRSLGSWVWWLVAELVVPLIRSTFYVTESEPYKQEVFYYRWAMGCDSHPCFVMCIFLTIKTRIVTVVYRSGAAVYVDAFGHQPQYGRLWLP